MNHILDAHVAYIKTISDLNQDKAELLKRIKRLEREVYALRLYGNRDCTAMADQALKEDK